MPRRKCFHRLGARGHAFQVLAWSALSGVLALGALAWWTREPLPSRATLLWAAGAGLSGALGLAALYRALAQGNAAVVSPFAGVVGAALHQVPNTRRLELIPSFPLEEPSVLLYLSQLLQMRLERLPGVGEGGQCVTSPPSHRGPALRALPPVSSQLSLSLSPRQS